MILPFHAVLRIFHLGRVLKVSGPGEQQNCSWFVEWRKRPTLPTARGT
jgi:hypothetical protein